jgi:competence protein ComEC
MAIAYAAGIALVEGVGDPLAWAAPASAACAAASLPATRARIALVLLGTCLAGAAAYGARVHAARVERPTTPFEATLDATVRERHALDAGVRLEVGAVRSVDGAALPSRVRIHVSRDAEASGRVPDAWPGDRIRARLRVGPQRSLRNPGARDFERDLARAGVGAAGWLDHPGASVRWSAESPTSWRALHEVRARIASALSERGEGGALLRALALGERRGLSRAALDAVAALGIGHLLAVSGLHLGLVAGLAYAIGRAALSRVPALAGRHDTRRMALAAAFAIGTLYAALAGGGVPVRRAWVFLACVACAVLAGRTGRLRSALAAAALIVLSGEPEALFRPGPQLSFAAAAALGGRRRSLGRGVGGLISVTAVAGAVTAPIAAWHWGRGAPVALAANLVAVPWTASVLLPAALLASIACALEVASAGVELAATLASWSLDAALVAGASVPAREAGRPATAWIVAAVLGALLVLRMGSAPARAAGCLVVGLTLTWAPVASLGPAVPRLVALDVGQGDALLVQGRSATVLVDAGRAIPGGIDRGRDSVVPALRALGVQRLDVLAVTHADVDHRGGVAAVIDSLPIRVLWIPVGARGDAAFAALLAQARARRIPIRERGSGDPPLALGDLRIDTLWPPRGAVPRAGNDRSLVLRIDAGSVRVLLPGDIERVGEAGLLASGVDLSAELLLLPHHGSRTSSSRAFLSAVAPRLAIASAPCAGRYGMPHPQVRDRVAATDADLWWTGRDGAVRVSLVDLAVRGTGPRRRHCPRRGAVSGRAAGPRARRRSGLPRPGTGDRARRPHPAAAPRRSAPARSRRTSGTRPRRRPRPTPACAGRSGRRAGGSRAAPRSPRTSSSPAGPSRPRACWTDHGSRRRRRHRSSRNRRARCDRPAAAARCGRPPARSGSRRRSWPPRSAA